jgi:protein gp37
MKDTNIQWCDSTVNPVAGCAGCELWTASAKRCYAGFLHTRFPTNPGFSPEFLKPKLFLGRMADAAAWPDLIGTRRPEKPWLDSLPRLIFVSDMGDALVSSCFR